MRDLWQMSLWVFSPSIHNLEIVDEEVQGLNGKIFRRYQQCVELYPFLDCQNY